MRGILEAALVKLLACCPPGRPPCPVQSKCGGSERVVKTRLTWRMASVAGHGFLVEPSRKLHVCCMLYIVGLSKDFLEGRSPGI